MLRKALVGWAVAVVAAGYAPFALGDAAQDQFNFATGLFITKDYESAVEEFETFLKRFPDSDKRAQAAYRIAEAWLRAGEREKAITAYESALKGFPKATEATLGHYNLGRSRLALKECEKALAAFRAALAGGDAKTKEEATVGAAECCVQLEKYREAVTLYSDFQKTFPKSAHRASMMFSHGWALFALGEHKDAIGVFEVFLREFPESADVPKARLSLSDAHAAVGEHAKAAAALEPLAKSGAMKEEVLLRQAWNLFRSGDRKESAGQFERFIKEFPKSSLRAAAQYNAGVAHFDSGGFAEAISLFKGVLEMAPASAEVPRARYWLGLALFNTKNYASALETLREAIRDKGLSDPNRETGAYTIAQSLARLSHHDEAIEELEKFLRKYPDSQHAPDARYALAVSLAQKGRLDEAVASARSVLAGKPGAELVQHTRFALAEYLFRLKRPADAIAPLQQLEQSGAMDGKARYRLAWSLFEVDRYADAREQFLRLVKDANEFSREAHYMSARSAEELGRKEDALQAYREVVQAKSDDRFAEQALHRLASLHQGEAALTDIQQYRKAYPKGRFAGDLQLKKAETLLSLDRFEEAQEAYEALLKKAAKGTTAIASTYGLAWCKMKQSQPKEAAALFAQVAENPDAKAGIRQDALLQQGELAYRAEAYEQARGFFRQVDATSPVRRERTLYMIGWCCRKLKQADEESEAFRNVIDEFPDGQFAADAALRLGEVLLGLGKAAESRPALEKALEKSPNPALTERLLDVLSAVLVELRDWKSAITVAERIKREFPKSEHVYLASFRLGVAHQALGLHDQAEACFLETMAQTDSHEAAQAQFNIGSLYFARKDYKSAAKNFLKVDILYDYPELSPKALFHALDSFKRAEEPGRAEIYRKRLIEKYPDSTWAKKLTEAK